VNKNQMKLKRQLGALGGDGDAVARALRDLGIRGSLCDAHRCPVALYLEREGWGAVLVNTDWVEACQGETGVSVATPDAVAVFVRDFDNGLYPYLKAPQEEG
jgi:hypothetical protein